MADLPVSDTTQAKIRELLDGKNNLRTILRVATEMEIVEREIVRQALEKTRWNRLRAARLLRISYRCMMYKMKDLGLRGLPADF